MHSSGQNPSSYIFKICDIYVYIYIHIYIYIITRFQGIMVVSQAVNVIGKSATIIQ